MAVLAVAGVVAIAAPSSAPQPSTSDAEAPAPRLKYPDLGVQFHGMWSNYTDAQREAVLDTLAGSGLRTVRIDVSWAMIQPSTADAYDPWGVAFVDRVIAMANGHGMRPVITFWLTPAWANGGKGEHTLPTDVDDYARAAQWAAARWAGKVDAWEVWTEPNSADFLAGADPLAYTELLRAAYPALHAGDPNTTVVFGSLQYNDDTWLDQAYDAGARDYFDVMSTHSYQAVADEPPTTPDDGTKWTFTHIAAVRIRMIARGDTAKPIWLTFGWSTHANPPGTPKHGLGVSEETQAAYATESLLLVSRDMPYITRAYWYTERDVAAGANIHAQNHGLLRADLSAKPALRALAQLARPNPTSSAQ